MADIGRSYLAVEVVNCSSLIGADNGARLDQLEAHRGHFLDTTIAEHHGRTVRATAVSLLVEFASPIEAVQCAVEVQRRMNERNIDTAPDRRIALRVGIHNAPTSGDLVLRAVAALPRDTLRTLIKPGTEIYDDPGNTASRIAALAEPGGIFISGTVRDILGDQLPYRFEDIGKQNLDIRGPVDCYAMRADLAVLKPRIGVQDQGGSPNQDSLSAATRASFSPLGTTFQKLVLTTAVVVTIAVWIAAGGAFLDSMHQLPENPAPSLAGKLAAAGKPAEAVQPIVAAADHPPAPPAAVSAPAISAPESPPASDQDARVDPAARELITQGWALYRLPYTFVRWQEARRYFEQALEQDPPSSEARIGLASILATKLADGWSPVLQEDIPRAEQLLLEVLEKRDISHQAAARFTLGVLRQMQTRLTEAQNEFETAISLDPTNAGAYFHLGETLLYLAEPERAIPALEMAIHLDPHAPSAALAYWALGTCQLLSGRVDQAIDLLRTARDTNAQLWVPYFYLAGGYGLHGDLDEARSALADSMRLKPAIRSLTRMRAENPWLSDPQYWALQENTLSVGLRRAGLPD